MVGIRSLGFAVIIAVHTVAQSTQPIATCTNSTYQWSFNSLGQSPCVVASLLGGVCNQGSFSVPSLQPGLVYVGPPLTATNGCRCSSPFYSLISACALCQSGQFLKWSAYGVNCSTVYTGVFPLPIPPGTRVPHWAYLDVLASDQFLPAAAQAAVGGSESTYIPQSTTSSSSASSTSTSTSSSSKSSSSNAGAIAGGVVGGVVGLALLAALFFWWTRRRRAQLAPSTLIDPTISTMSFNHTAPLVGSRSPKLYDPSDPSTFPSSPATSGTYTVQQYPPSSQSIYSNPNQVQGTLHPNTNQGHYYTGVPEL
ncbi:hypothetical protein L208DRAFT_1403785 [Tricholoma matsutake]|nr:hypothetical protein L208DRAFT_1403785 [Tricholoma matsutake 945]